LRIVIFRSSATQQRDPTICQAAILNLSYRIAQLFHVVDDAQELAFQTTIAEDLAMK
jgi:hypothetical protein